MSTAGDASRPGSPACGRRPRSVSLADLPTLVQRGDLVYVPGSSGAPAAFMTELLRNPARTRDLHILTSYVPGINALDLNGLHETGEVTGLFMQASVAAAHRMRRYRALPMSYFGFVRYLQQVLDIDLAVIQVAPPDSRGNCSLGPAVEFAPTVLSKSRRRLAMINACTPALPGAFSVPLDSFDYVCEIDDPLPVYELPTDADTEAIARQIATLVDDRSVLQVGLGKVTAALLRNLGDRRGLRLHSGLLSDGLLDLVEAGALDMSVVHTAAVLLGSKNFYQRIRHVAALQVLGCDITHDPCRLAQIGRFIAVNAALEVDLFGQCNLEHSQGAAISGPGGAPDFARAGALSPGGASVVALPARYKHGSRIVPILSSPAVTTLPRTDVDFVVTEFGIARLKGASVHERAAALIDIAAPEFREELHRNWERICSLL